ncbi:MAG: DedA family protein [bacterium]|nr:DedA family protein [bacterium]
MKEFLYPLIKGIIESDYALIGLFGIAFAESSFFPIPPDTLMIPMALINPVMALWYALITTLGSVLGGMFGYLIGLKGGKPVVKKFISEEKLRKVRQYYHKWDVWAVSVAAFTPIPYKVFTIAAGLFDLDFWRFVIASALGRGGRFFLVGGLIFIFGPAIKTFLDSYFEIVIIGLSVLLIGGFWLFNKLTKKDTDEPTSSTG